MNCRDFDQIWNRLLDDEPPSRRGDGDGDGDGAATANRPDLENRLRDHAAACEDCRERQLQFETLRRALRAWAGRSGQRELAPTSPRRRRRRARIAVVAMAAAATIAAAMIGAPGPPLRPVAEVEPTARGGLLRAAVDDATAASWRLARLATEPAARLGSEMIDASFPPAVQIALLDEPAPGDSAWSAPEVFSRMSGHLIAGVEPVSVSAREAFGFLRSPAPQ